VVEIEKNSNAYDKVLKEIARIKEKTSESFERYSELCGSLSLYEAGKGLEELSDEGLEDLENLVLARLETIETSKLKQNLRSRLNSVQDKLKRQVPGQILKELVNFSVNIN